MMQHMSTTNGPNYAEITGLGVTPAAARHIVGGAPTTTFNANDAAPAESSATASVSTLARSIVRAAMRLVPEVSLLDKGKRNFLKFTATGAIERRHGYPLNHEGEAFAEMVISCLPAAGQVLAASRNLPILTNVEKIELLVELALNEHSLTEAAKAAKLAAQVETQIVPELPPCEAKLRSTRRFLSFVNSGRESGRCCGRYHSPDGETPAAKKATILSKAIDIAENPLGSFDLEDSAYDEGDCLEPGVTVITTESGATVAFCGLTAEEMAEIAEGNRAKALATRKERARYFKGIRGSKGFRTGTTLSSYISH